MLAVLHAHFNARIVSLCHLAHHHNASIHGDQVERPQQVGNRNHTGCDTQHVFQLLPVILLTTAPFQDPPV
jgi:hypothetical protein